MFRFYKAWIVWSFRIFFFNQRYTENPLLFSTAFSMVLTMALLTNANGNANPGNTGLFLRNYIDVIGYISETSTILVAVRYSLPFAVSFKFTTYLYCECSNYIPDRTNLFNGCMSLFNKAFWILDGVNLARHIVSDNRHYIDIKSVWVFFCLF
jgi:hypothetical protein